MIQIKKLITNLEIKSVNDLYKLKPLMEVTSLNINKSEIARELNMDRTTLSKYLHPTFLHEITIHQSVKLQPIQPVPFVSLG